jgi:hypothetical protein
MKILENTNEFWDNSARIVQGMDKQDIVISLFVQRGTFSKCNKLYGMSVCNREKLIWKVIRLVINDKW